MCCPVSVNLLFLPTLFHTHTRAQLNVTVSNHLRDLPQLTSSVKYEVVTDATRDALTGAWKTWMEELREFCTCVLVCAWWLVGWVWRGFVLAS